MPQLHNGYSVRYRWMVFFALTALCALFFSVGVAAKASADTDGNGCNLPLLSNAQNSASMPRPCDFSGSGTMTSTGNDKNMRLDVADSGSGGNSLTNLTSIVKIYSTDSSPSLTIYGADHCAKAGYDTFHYIQTSYAVYQEKANGDQGSQVASYDNQKHTDCNDGGNDENAILNLSHPDGTQTFGDQTFYVWTFEATIGHDGIGAVNSFALHVSSGYIGYSHDSGDHFALQNRESGTDSSTFYLPMATSCDVNAASTRALHWFDDDYGNSGVQPQDIVFYLYDQTTGDKVPLTDPSDVAGNPLNYMHSLGGNDYTPSAGSGNSGTATFTAQPQHKYVWVWHYVSNNNGIQFQLPFDSIYHDVDCNSPPSGSVGAISCTMGGDAKAALTFADPDGSGSGGDDTYAYAKIAGSANNPTANYSGSTLSDAGWTRFGSGNSGSIPIDSSQTGGDYAVFLYVQDDGPQGDGLYHREDKQVININCDQAPTVSALASCTTISGTAKDADNTNTQIRIDVYEDGTAYPTNRQYTTHTSGSSHTYNINMADVLAGNVQSNGKYNPYPSPAIGTPTAGGANANPGSSIDWNGHAFYVAAISVDSTGHETGVNNTFSPAQTAGPCAQVSCGANVTLGNMTVGVPQPFKVTAATTTSGGPPAPVPGFTVAVKNASGVTQTLTPASPVAYDSSSGDGGVLSSVATSFTPNTAGNYTVTYSWADAGHTKTNTATNCGGSGTAAYSPYFESLGTDVAAGPGFGSSCTPNSSAGIYSSNRDTDGTGNPLFYGAGSQLAALALGDISSFATSQVNKSDGTSKDAGAGEPSGLAFSNNTAPVSGTTYGALFGHSGGAGSWCVTDYVTSAQEDTANVPTPLTAPGGAVTLSDVVGDHQREAYTYDATGSYLTINASTLPAGAKLTIIVKGDVFITGDIDYAGYSTADTSDIPQFKLLVSGNIYVRNASAADGVDTLRGFYDAQPSAAAPTTTGIFSSCAQAASPSPVAITNDYAACNRPLTVYGGVSAQSLNLGRTYGNLVAVPSGPSAVTADPAEKFVFTPELWLADLQTGTSCTANGARCKYAAFTSLPPVLQ